MLGVLASPSPLPKSTFHSVVERLNSSSPTRAVFRSSFVRKSFVPFSFATDFASSSCASVYLDFGSVDITGLGGLGIKSRFHGIW